MDSSKGHRISYGQHWIFARLFLVILKLTWVLIPDFLFSEVAEAQIDRYISLPGQAVAYKIGEREIQRLRRKYSPEMGLKKFHTAILKCIGPLGDLESCILGYFSHQ